MKDYTHSDCGRAASGGLVNMSKFTFIHAADLHLDSPLLGLASKSQAFAERVAEASRQAFDNLIDLAISEQCRFVIFAGDVFDGDLRNFKAGLFFVDRLRRLGEAGIEVYMTLGNHDAENRFVKKLAFSSNVHVFASHKAETIEIGDLHVALHGRSFPQRDVTDNLARTYPPPKPGAFNIGVLHTACVGREGPHAAYAPCSVEQLVNHGYDYWALGHIHAREVLNARSPAVVYPGNIQGRSVRETGDKGATLVTVEDGATIGLEHRALDVVRWAHLLIDVSPAQSQSDLIALIRQRLVDAVETTGGRSLAARISLTGTTPLHANLLLTQTSLREDIEIVCTTLGEEIWVEKIVVATAPPALDPGLDASIAGQIVDVLKATPTDALSARLEARLAEIQAKLPATARAQDLIDRLRADSGRRSLDLAVAILAEEG